MQQFKELNDSIEEYDHLKIYAGIHCGKATYGPVGSNHKI